MGGGVVLAEVMGVAGGHQRQAEPVGDVDGALGAQLLDVQAVVLDLDVEVLAEERVEPARPAWSASSMLVLEDELAELAGGAAAQADEALGVGGRAVPCRCAGRSGSPPGRRPTPS